MTLTDRVRNIIVTPRTEWPRIAAEPATVNGLFTGYAVIVALLPVVGTILGALLFHGSLVAGVVTGVVGYAIGLGILFVMGIVADALAPSFDGVKDRVGGTKLVVYSATAQWVAGFFGFIPGVNVLVGLAGFAWGAYLLYLGSMSVMRVPEAKALGYAAVLIVIWLLLAMVVGAVVLGLVLSVVLGAFATPFVV